MRTLTNLRHLRVPRGVRLLGLVAAGALGSLLLPMPAAAQPTPLSEGVVCNTSTAKYPSFLLTTSGNYIKTPDGNNIYMWGYALGNGSFQYPGPVLCVNEGDNVTITVKNTLPVPTSLIFPGISRVMANGKLEVLDPQRASLAQAVLAGSPTSPRSITYTFTATNPGTYLYESGTNPEVQVQMGMLGAIIVRPSLNPDDLTNPSSCASLSAARTLPANTWYVPGEKLVYDDCASAYNPQREFMHLLTEVDPHMHAAIEKATCADVAPGTIPACVPTPAVYDMNTYVARYFMINGRSFPDDITPNFAPALPQQPYGALVHVNPKNFDATNVQDYNPLPALVRFLSGGPVTYPFHPHSNHDQQIGTDGRELVDSSGVSLSFDRFGFVMAPGQTAEALFNWTDGQGFAASTPGIGVPEPNIQNRTDGPFWSGTPYLGVKLPLNPGRTQWNACGEYYQFAHSHALFQITNYGASGGGMLTLIRVDPSKSFQQAHNENCDSNGPGY
jgi:FtsP/CotA-like multicopper oxidase with cupredoxin domain